MDPSSWARLANDVLNDIRHHWTFYVVFVGVALLMIRVQQIAGQNVRQIGEKIEQNHLEPIKSTFDVLLMTVGTALPVPVLLAFVAWRLRSFGADQLGEYIGAGLLIVAIVILPLEFLRQVCRPKGLAQAHFQYPSAAVAYSRTNDSTLVDCLLAVCVRDLDN